MTEEDTKQIADYDTYQKSLSDGFATALKVSQTEQASHYKLTLLRAKTTPLSTKTSAKFELILGPVEESHHPDTNVSDNRIWKDTVAMTEALGSRIGKVLNECMNSDFYHGVKTSSFCSKGDSWGRIDSFKADEDTSLAKGDKYPRIKVIATTMCGAEACTPSDNTLIGELDIGALRVFDDTAMYGETQPPRDSNIGTKTVKSSGNRSTRDFGTDSVRLLELASRMRPNLTM